MKVLILDDSLFERSRSKAVELLSNVFDHNEGKLIKGFQLLTLGWSDGATFVPMAFSLVASTKHLLMGISETIDKRTSGYKRRQEALKSKPELAAQMIEQALATGIQADYVLMDSWFTEEPLIQKVKSSGLDVIGMIKRTQKRLYQYKGKHRNLIYLLSYCDKNTQTPGIIGSVQVKMKRGTAAKIVFVQHRTNTNKWLAILNTETSLSVEEIIRIYGYRWEIEVFFKCNKSHLKLNKEFQCRSYDSMIAHTIIVFSRYIFLAWERRKNNDLKTLGYLFFEFGEDIKEVDYKDALNALFKIVWDLATNGGREIVINTAELKN